MKSPNHALQRTGSAVTAPAADHRHLSTHRQVPRPLRLSLSLLSFGVLLACPVNHAFLSPSRTHALTNSETFTAESVARPMALPSRSLDPATACSPAAFSARQGLRPKRGLEPARTFLAGSLLARRCVCHAQAPDAGANPTQTPNQALQRTAPARHAGCSRRLRPQPPCRSQRAAPPQSLSLGSFGDFAHLP